MHVLILSVAYELDKEDDGYKNWDLKSLRDLSTAPWTLSAKSFHFSLYAI